MTDAGTVMKGVLIALVGTFAFVSVFFLGSTVWDEWQTGMDDAGLAEDKATWSYSHAIGFGNLFYSSCFFGVIMSWAYGFVYVYKTQNYDAYAGGRY